DMERRRLPKQDATACTSRDGGRNRPRLKRQRKGKHEVWLVLAGGGLTCCSKLFVLLCCAMRYYPGDPNFRSIHSVYA
uniref:Uncharacterized protein n=1 Tax=Aegilops tauschii subsp. strangulata TaxID=200361 RepID=A0A453SYS7_AEGTS